MEKLQRTSLDSLKAMETTKDLGREVTWVFLHGVFSNDGPFGDSVGLETLSNPTESVCVPSLEQWRRKILLSKISETLCLIRSVQWRVKDEFGVSDLGVLMDGALIWG